jgi:hypothetical protein
MVPSLIVLSLTLLSLTSVSSVGPDDGVAHMIPLPPPPHKAACGGLSPRRPRRRAGIVMER